ncbi:MAG: 3TM-type holin [Methylorubrum rhodinum]|uniref:3TM-type holin n=1 Tax=Methylorubrum rhodinum TaxID=29428 RepID=UPI003BB0DD74
MAGGIIGSIVGGVLTGGAGPAIGEGIGRTLPTVADIAKVVVDRLVPDPAARAAAAKEIEDAISAREAVVVQAITEQNAAQNALNLAEAQGNDRFSSRWRPALGWICVSGMAYQFVFAPIITWVGTLIGVALGFAFPAPPTLVVSDFMPLLIGMLGLGAMRTYERTTGVPGAIPGAPQGVQRRG